MSDRCVVCEICGGLVDRYFGEGLSCSVCHNRMIICFKCKHKWRTTSLLDGVSCESCERDKKIGDVLNNE